MQPLSWETPEYHHQEKTAEWYWVVGLVALSLAVAAILFNNILIAILVVVATVALMLVASRPPRIIEVHIDDRGVTVGKLYYPYDNLESFWIHEYGNAAKLLITSKKTFASQVAVFLNDVSVEEVRAALKAHIPEKERHEPLFQMLMEYLGF